MFFLFQSWRRWPLLQFLEKEVSKLSYIRASVRLFEADETRQFVYCAITRIMPFGIH